MDELVDAMHGWLLVLHGTLSHIQKYFICTTTTSVTLGGNREVPPEQHSTIRRLLQTFPCANSIMVEINTKVLGFIDWLIELLGDFTEWCYKGVVVNEVIKTVTMARTIWCLNGSYRQCIKYLFKSWILILTICTLWILDELHRSPGCSPFVTIRWPVQVQSLAGLQIPRFQTRNLFFVREFTSTLVMLNGKL